MGEIEIVEGKVLKLNKVLIRPMNDGGGDTREKTMRMFDSYMRSNGMKPYGPAIIRVKNTISDNRLMCYSDLMVQLKEVPEDVSNPYRFEELIRIENCLMARYRGPASSLYVAYSKMQVYSFEHSIALSDTTFTVFLEQTADGDLMADIFVEAMK